MTTFAHFTETEHLDMEDNHFQANADHFISHFNMIAQGGFYMWIDKGHKYHRHGHRMMAENIEAWNDIREITPKGWAKEHIVLLRK